MLGYHPLTTAIFYGRPQLSPRARILPAHLRQALRITGIRPTRYVLIVSVQAQRMYLLQSTMLPGWPLQTRYVIARDYRISTSRFGHGQLINSNQTPLGLHRIARKIGLGHPVGTVFKSRKAIGLTWQGLPDAAIVHRILWLEGLEPGRNRGGLLDTFMRYIYIHGFGDESTLGKPHSRGCIHMAAKDLIPLSDRLPIGTLVWIALRSS